MSRFIFLMVSFWVLGAADIASAQILTPSLSLFYFQNATKRDYPSTADTTDRITQKETYTFINLGVCYNLRGLCLGLKYLQGELATKVSSPGNPSASTAVFHGPGISLGYSGAEGIVAHASVLLAAKKSIETLSTTFFCKSAYIIELGYGFKVSSVRVGPLLGIYQFEYNKKEVNGVSTSLKPKESDKFVMPQLALWIDL